MPTVEPSTTTGSSVRKSPPSSLAAAYLAAAREGEEEETCAVSASLLKQPPPSVARSPSPTKEEEETTAKARATTKVPTKTEKLSMSEELRTQICSNKYCQCIRRDGKMHRVQDLVRSRLNEHIAKQKRVQQEQLEAQARDFLESLDQPLIATVRPVKLNNNVINTAATATATTNTNTTTTPEATTATAAAAAVEQQQHQEQVRPAASTVTTTTTTAAAAAAAATASPPTPRGSIKNHVSYHQAVQAAVKQLDPKVWKINASFCRKKRRVEATWKYPSHQQDNNDYNYNNTTTTRTATATTPPKPPSSKRFRASVTVPQTIQTTGALLHSKRGSFRHRRPSELTVASELTAQSVMAATADLSLLPAAMALHTLTDEEEAAIVSLATATGNGTARWSTRASLPSVRFYARTSTTAPQEAAAAQRNY